MAWSLCGRQKIDGTHGKTGLRDLRVSGVLTISDNPSDRAVHSLNQCTNAQQLVEEVRALTGCSPNELVDSFIDSRVPRAVFAVGSLPWGMGTRTSSIELLVLVDDFSALGDSAADA